MVTHAIGNFSSKRLFVELIKFIISEYYQLKLLFKSHALRKRKTWVFCSGSEQDRKALRQWRSYHGDKQKLVILKVVDVFAAKNWVIV